jgi:hypothetical protein
VAVPACGRAAAETRARIVRYNILHGRSDVGARRRSPLLKEVLMSAARTVTIDFAADADAIVISVQLDTKLAELVFADADARGVRPSEVVTNALLEHYERLDPRGRGRSSHDAPTPRTSASPAAGWRAADERVDDASRASFPASDAPSWWQGP